MAGLLEFAARFGTEERCIEHLAELRWPGGFVCAGCGGRQAWRLKARPRVYECTACRRQESVTAGTVPASDPDGSLEVVCCRLPDGLRQARRLDQIFAARTGRSAPDGLDHGA